VRQKLTLPGTVKVVLIADVLLVVLLEVLPLVLRIRLVELTDDPLVHEEHYD